MVERVIEKMSAVQQKPEPSEPPKSNRKFAFQIRNSARTRPSAGRSPPQLERPGSSEVASNQEYQSTINRLMSVIENKFLDIVILIDGSDSFNQINEG